jgi:hypothetical protein
LNVPIFFDGNKIEIFLSDLEFITDSVMLIGRKERIYKEQVPVKAIRHFLRDCQTLNPDGIQIEGNNIVLLMPVYVAICSGMKILGFLRKINAKASLTVNNEPCTGDCANCAIPQMLAR